MGGGWLRRLTPVLLAPLAACSLLVDTDVGVADGDGGTPDGGLPDDDGGGDGADAGPCGSIGRLQDDFSEEELSSHWVPRTQGTGANQPVNLNDFLRLRFDPVPGADEFSEVESRFAYDLRDHDVTVRTLGQGAAGWTTLEVREAAAFDRPRRIIGMGRLDDDMVAFVAGDPIATILSVPFNDGNHRYWRIRESGGGLEFEVAGDSFEFSSFASLASPELDLGAVMVGLRLFSGDPPSASIGSSDFDDFNTSADAEPACPIERLRDDFSAGDLGPLWIDNGSAGDCSLSTGAEGLAMSVDPGGSCFVDSAHAYWFADGAALVVEITQFPDLAAATTALRFARDPDNYAELHQQAGQLEIRLIERGGVTDSVSLSNDVDAQWWRVSRNGGDLVVETSMDGSEFSPRRTLSTTSLDLAELRVSFSLQSGEAATARLAGINF